MKKKFTPPKKVLMACSAELVEILGFQHEILSCLFVIQCYLSALNVQILS